MRSELLIIAGYKCEKMTDVCKSVVYCLLLRGELLQICGVDLFYVIIPNVKVCKCMPFVFKCMSILLFVYEVVRQGSVLGV